MKRYAVYRCLYGEDFIQQSINSINDYVDKIFVFWDDTPWADVTGVRWKGKWVEFPKKFDNIIEKIKELNNPKIELIYDHQYNNFNQFTHLINDLVLPNYSRPDQIMVIEIDHVFRKDQLEKSIQFFISSDFTFATTRQIELWRYFNYCIPRNRGPCTVFWNMNKVDKLPETLRQATPKGNRPTLNTYVHNLGFCASEHVMRWKHLTAIAFSQKIKDGEPEESWFEEKWLAWNLETNNENLEISKGRSHIIPYAQRYDIQELPEVLKDVRLSKYYDPPTLINNYNER